MKLFGRKKTETAISGGTLLHGDPMPGGRRKYDPPASVPAYVEPPQAGLTDEAMAIYETMSMEQLIAENKALRMELSALKSRVSYIKTVLLANVPTMDMLTPGGIAQQMAPASMAQPQPAQAPMPQPQAAPAQGASRPDPDLHAMLAQLKQDISAIKSAPAPAPAQQKTAAADDDVRRMLAELKNDISAIKSTPAPAPAPKAAAADDDVRRMLAELKSDIRGLKQSTGAQPVTPPAQDDIRGLLLKLQEDIQSLKAGDPNDAKPQASGAHGNTSTETGPLSSGPEMKEQPILSTNEGRTTSSEKEELTENAAKLTGNAIH